MLDLGVAFVLGIAATLITLGAYGWATAPVPDDYQPRHLPHPDALVRAITDPRTALWRQSAAPWSHRPPTGPYPPNVTVTKPKENSPMDLKKIAVRAVVTAIQAVLAVLVAAGTTDLSVETAQAALMAGVAALLSVAYNTANQYLEANP